MTPTDLEKSIVRTICHFDVLDYPLTLLEMANFLEVKITTIELMQALSHEPLASLISNSQGWYFLRGRQEIIKKRKNRYRLYLKKMKRAKNFARIFSIFPWIRAVAIYGSLALKNSSIPGDIDLFIITSANRAWSARFFINAFLKIFNLRPTTQTTQDKICISYLADENNLDLSAVNLTNDYYYYYYGAGSFTFLMDTSDLRQKFCSANNWLGAFLPNNHPRELADMHQPKPVILKIQRILEKTCGAMTEATYRNWQEKILPQRYWQAKDGKKVILSSGLIKLHDNDKREKFNALFEENFQRALGNYEN